MSKILRQIDATDEVFIVLLSREEGGKKMLHSLYDDSDMTPIEVMAALAVAMTDYCKNVGLDQHETFNLIEGAVEAAWGMKAETSEIVEEHPGKGH